MTDETTSEQLAEIEGQGDTVQVREGRWRTRGGAVKNIRPCEPLRGAYFVWPWTDGVMTFQDNGLHQGSKESPNDLVEYLGPIEPDKTQELPDKTQELPKYTPPEGWRVVQFGEQLLPGDVWVNQDATEQRSNILQWDASAVSGGRCIRRIKPEPQAEPEPQPEPETDTDEKIRRLQAAIDERADLDTADQTRIELQGRIRELETIRDTQAATIEELRSEVSYVQRLLGESRQRVTPLEELVTSLRTINRGCETAVREAGNMNTALRNQLAAVKAELASVAADRQQLRVELDAAQQVPADSPELRQLRADLAEVTRERDQYRHCYDEVSSHLETIEKTAKAEAIEAIVEWLVPIRTCGSQALATAVISNLPHIMRSLTGLEDEGIE